MRCDFIFSVTKISAAINGYLLSCCVHDDIIIEIYIFICVYNALKDYTILNRDILLLRYDSSDFNNFM